MPTVIRGPAMKLGLTPIRSVADLAREAGVSEEELRTISYIEFWARLSARRREFSERDTLPEISP